MSIYAVKISGKDGWYVKGQAFETEIQSLRNILPYLKCEVCGKPVTWRAGYVMHSITFGGPDQAYCGAKCLKA